MTFPRLALRPAGCEIPDKRTPSDFVTDHLIRFAFVEYEDRRDADDAYYEMHNKRMGRDDILKIEVCLAQHESTVTELTRYSGHAHHHPLLGALNLVVIVTAAEDAPHDAVAHLLPVEAIAIIPLARMIAEIATGIMIVTVVVIGTDPAVPTPGKPCTF